MGGIGDMAKPEEHTYAVVHDFVFRWTCTCGAAFDTELRLREHFRDHRPYGFMCRDPDLCFGKGYCPRDPNCGD
jgi:hypothetical protein